jgi:hypothetical protein
LNGLSVIADPTAGVSLGGAATSPARDSSSGTLARALDEMPEPPRSAVGVRFAVTGLANPALNLPCGTRLRQDAENASCDAEGRMPKAETAQLRHSAFRIRHSGGVFQRPVSLVAQRCPVIPRTACALPLSLLLFTDTLQASDAVDFAASLIGRPYVWGAEGPDSFDCSGLTQFVFREFGVDLPRRAISQSRVGDPTGSRLRRGDLVFFASDTRRSEVTHVGIYEGGGIMIDASKRHGRVRRDNLGEEYWVDRFMFARRVGGWTNARRVPQEPEEDERVRRPDGRRDDRRRAAVRVLGRIAEALLRRPRR